MKNSDLNITLKPINVSLTIPVYNNQKTLIPQLNQCAKVLNGRYKKYEIIVCDDNSKDKTPQLLKKHFFKKRFKLIFHDKNWGVTKTIYSLYKLAKYEYIVIFSVDGSWNPNDIPKLLDLAYEKKMDIVVGLRKEKNYSIYRKIISWIYNFLPRIFFSVNTYDAGSIKVVKRSVFKEIKLISKSIFFEAELIIKASKKGYKILSHPVDHYKSLGKSSSGGKVTLVLNAMFDVLRLKIVGLYD